MKRITAVFLSFVFMFTFGITAFALEEDNFSSYYDLAGVEKISGTASISASFFVPGEILSAKIAANVKIGEYEVKWYRVAADGKETQCASGESYLTTGEDKGNRLYIAVKPTNGYAGQLVSEKYWIYEKSSQAETVKGKLEGALTLDGEMRIDSVLTLELKDVSPLAAEDFKVEWRAYTSDGKYTLLTADGKYKYTLKESDLGKYIYASIALESEIFDPYNKGEAKKYTFENSLECKTEKTVLKRSAYEAELPIITVIRYNYIEIKTSENHLYRVNDGEWSASGQFFGLENNTYYEIGFKTVGDAYREDGEEELFVCRTSNAPQESTPQCVFDIKTKKLSGLTEKSEYCVNDGAWISASGVCYLTQIREGDSIYIRNKGNGFDIRDSEIQVIFIAPEKTEVIKKDLDTLEEKTALNEIRAVYKNAVLRRNGEAVDNENTYVSTGDILYVTDSENNKCYIYTVIIKGDTDGNGSVDSTDYLIIKRVFLKTYALSTLYEKAADVDGNGKIDSTDFLQIKRHFLKTYNIFK